MYYYHLHAESPCAGTDRDKVFITNDPELQIDIEDIKQGLFNDYGYLINGGKEEPNEEQIKEFFDNCNVYIHRVPNEVAISMIEDDDYEPWDLR